MEAEDDTDEALMLRYAGGDAAGFDLLYGRHRGPVFRYLLRQLSGNRGQAEELFQDVWMSVIGARGGYKVEARFTTWLYTIAHNRVIDHYRRHRALEVAPLNPGHDDDPAPELPAPATTQPERIAQAREQARRLLELVEALPVAQREAFLLHEEGGLSLDEIAAVTGADREAIKSRLRYALSKLRQGMGDLL
jgi:RNA polymerase sigma-70 factor (ECF subfamily)